MNEKEFGKLSSQQAKEFYTYFLSSMEEAVDAAKTIDQSEINIKFIPPWYKLYEYNYNQLVAYFLISMDFSDKFIEFASCEDPEQKLLEFIKSDQEPQFEFESFSNQKKVNFICALFANLMCLTSLGEYKKNMCQLVYEASEGHDKSLFQAICVDRTVINTDVAARRLARASMEEDEQFFDHIAKSIKGSFPRRPPEKYSGLRFMTALLEDAAGTEDLDKDALYELCVNDLDLYPDASKSEDSYGSFVRYINRNKSKSRT